MSNPSLIPVLRGSRGTLLQFTGDALTWRRDATEVTIPLQAIAGVRTEGRTVTVELLAPAGTPPAVHRVDGVSQAAAAVFVPAVTAALPERTEEDGTVDGSALVSSYTEPEPEHDPWEHMLRNVAIGIGVLSVASAVVAWILGDLGGAIVVLLGAPIGLGITAFGISASYPVFLQCYLPRFGITVEAKELRRYLGNATYAYTELDGAQRTIYGSKVSGVPYVAYAAGRPDRRTLCYSPLKTAGDFVFALLVLLVGLGALAFVVFLAVVMNLP
ncbi:hypothetical protein ABZY68_01690 [Streptomyces sp. NPDC006482]|uniref:hypothetical protein n=1 Tax=Streptomyces sp. NPDC006482 TaxID=3154306 RepID=UPI0033A6121E